MRQTIHGGLLAISLLLLIAGCDRRTLATSAVGIPPDAVFAVSAPSLSELRKMAQLVEPLTIPVGDDEAKPAWFACEPKLCVLHSADSANRGADGAIWRIPTASGSLVVWGAPDEAAVDAAIARWQTGTPPTPSTDRWTGFIEPAPLLERWQPTKPRARELVERVTFQAGRIDFEVTTADNVVDAELRMQPRPGEPVFVRDLGQPSAPLLDVAGLAAPGALGIVRLSAAPDRVWELLRSVLSAAQRSELDAFIASLKTEAAVDLEAQVLGSFTGHALVFAYEIADSEPTAITDLVTLRATSEAILLPVSDRKPLRRALDAWTQLSKGRLQMQAVAPLRQEWAWFEGDEIAWTAILAEDYLLVVDSPAALDQARQWEREPTSLPQALRARGVDELLDGADRSGAYLDLAALRGVLPSILGDLPAIDTVSATAQPDESGELVRVRLTF